MDILKILEQAQKTGFSEYKIDGCNPGLIFDLETSLLSRFLKEKEFKGDFWLEDVLNENPLHDGVSLVVEFDEDRYLFDGDESMTLEQYLSNCYLAYFQTNPQPSLTLASPLSLLKLLPAYADHFVDKGIEPIQDIAGKKCKPMIYDWNLKWLRKEENLSKMVYACHFFSNGMGCGDPWCASDYAWIQNGVALFYLDTGSSSIAGAWIYPFVTDCCAKFS